MYKAVSAEEAVKVIKSNDRVYIQAAASASQILINAMSARHEELRGVEVCHLHIEGETPYADPKYKDSFHVNSLFIGKNVRHTIKAGNGSYTPVFLSEVPNLFKRNVLPVDVALIQVSTPDKHGYCSLGVSVEAILAVIANAKHVIAQINDQMPRVHGEGLIHISELNTFVECSEPIHEFKIAEPTEIESKIGDNVAQLIDDRSTLQMGIGNIHNAVLSKLIHHKDLGLHTEMFSDGVLELVEVGAINNSNKKVARGRTVTGFVTGSERLYRYVDDNPEVTFLDIEFVNNPVVIAKNPLVTSINSAIQIDLTGQVCADSMGHKIYSGVGGQVDFVLGATFSDHGKSIIALPSTARKGSLSRLVPALERGAGVVTTRAAVDYVITEYGVAELRGRSLTERARDLIKIAHPDFREQLAREAWDSLAMRV